MAGAVGATIRECFVASQMHQGAYFVTNSIGDTTTPEQFDAFLQDGRAQGYQLNYGGRLGYTALELAIDKGNVDLVRHIIQLARAAQMDVVNLSGSAGHTPLMNAVYCPHSNAREEIARILIDAGAEVNVCSKRMGGITPVYLAASNGEERLVRLFLDQGALINPKIEQFVHNRSQCHYWPRCTNDDVLALEHSRSLGYSRREDLTEWTRPMLEVVEKVRRVSPYSLLLLAAIGVKQVEHQGIDPFEEWDEGVTLPTDLDPYMKMAANLVSDQSRSE